MGIFGGGVAWSYWEGKKADREEEARVKAEVERIEKWKNELIDIKRDRDTDIYRQTHTLVQRDRDAKKYSRTLTLTERQRHNAELCFFFFTHTYTDRQTDRHN